MAQTVSVIVSPENRTRLATIIVDRNRLLKHAQRARIVLLSAGRLPPQEIARESLLFSNSEIKIPNVPGLGLELDEEACARHPYIRHPIRQFDANPPSRPASRPASSLSEWSVGSIGRHRSRLRRLASAGVT
jgi:hypothetical protein